MTKSGDKKDWGKHSYGMGKGSASGFWCMGFIGALIYYWGSIESFYTFVVAMFKSILWPAYLVYDLLQFLSA